MSGLSRSPWRIPRHFFSISAPRLLCSRCPWIASRQFGDDWVKPGRVVSNGAYMLEDWRINDKIRLRKNPYYWNASKVALETVEALPISVATVAFNFFAGGLADLISRQES